MKFARIVLALLALTDPARATCGDSGGPGYRKPNGKCAGWAELGRACGTPPTTKCSAETIHPDATAAADKGVAIQSLMSGAHQKTRH